MDVLYKLSIPLEHIAKIANYTLDGQEPGQELDDAIVITLSIFESKQVQLSWH